MRGFLFKKKRRPAGAEKPAKVSAGLLMYRLVDARVEVLLAHPGGPFWVNKDTGAWTIPKGEVQPGEDLLEAARREFAEETGATPQAPFLPLGQVTQRSGKIVHAWAFAGDFEPHTLCSGTYDMEWPPNSGRTESFPEIDRVEFFPLTTARGKLIPAQHGFLDRLLEVMPGA